MWHEADDRNHKLLRTFQTYEDSCINRALVWSLNGDGEDFPGAVRHYRCSPY